MPREQHQIAGTSAESVQGEHGQQLAGDQHESPYEQARAERTVQRKHQLRNGWIDGPERGVIDPHVLWSAKRRGSRIGGCIGVRTDTAKLRSAVMQIAPNII